MPGHEKETGPISQGRSSDQEAREEWVKDEHPQSFGGRIHQAHNNVCLKAAWSSGAAWERERPTLFRHCSCHFCASGDNYNCTYRRSQ